MKKTKNNLSRTGAFIAILALGTSCFAGGTLAKYVTSGNATDTARVAKFGVEIAATTANMFSTEYAKDDTAYEGKLTVQSSTTDKVVAPGTKGDVAAFTLSGTPEVAVRVSYSADTVDFGDNWVDADGGYYCPIIVTVGDADVNGLDYTSIDAFESAIQTAVNAYTVDYDPNTDLAALGTSAPNVSWRWDFETGNTDAEKTANDVKDTYLGDQAADGNAATIKMAITAKVTQID